MTSTLAVYQARLLELVRSPRTPAQIRDELAADPRLAILRPYIATLDDRALEVARELVARWGTSEPVSS